jgi:hypothetical protein
MFWVIRAIQSSDEQVTDGLGKLYYYGTISNEMDQGQYRHYFGAHILVGENGTFLQISCKGWDVLKETYSLQNFSSEGDLEPGHMKSH